MGYRGLQGRRKSEISTALACIMFIQCRIQPLCTAEISAQPALPIYYNSISFSFLFCFPCIWFLNRNVVWIGTFQSAMHTGTAAAALFLMVFYCCTPP